jgi:hypothetical protein
MKRCFYQIFKPEIKTRIIPNVGDCSICKTDENNKYCKNYKPVNITIFEYRVNGIPTKIPT